MPSYDINGKQISNNYIMEPEKDNNCCSTTISAGIFFVVIGVIVKYAC